LSRDQERELGKQLWYESKIFYPLFLHIVLLAIYQKSCFLLFVWQLGAFLNLFLL